eukprot:12709-Heterococcus_DN1.PRE.2
MPTAYLQRALSCQYMRSAKLNKPFFSAVAAQEQLSRMRIQEDSSALARYSKLHHARTSTQG